MPSRDWKMMSNEAIKALGLKLMSADTEEAVLRLLSNAGLWEDESLQDAAEGHHGKAGDQSRHHDPLAVAGPLESVPAPGRSLVGGTSEKSSASAARRADSPPCFRSRKA